MEGGEAADDLWAQAKMDTLRIYGFSFQFPMVSRLEFNPKFSREEGDLAIKSPEKATVFFTWGDLGKVTKKGRTLEDHSDFSLERVKKSVQGKLEQVERKEIRVNSHPAIYNRVKVEVPRRGPFGKGQNQDVVSVHVHCERSGRYFLVYSTLSATAAGWQERTVQGIIDSLACH